MKMKRFLPAIAAALLLVSSVNLSAQPQAEKGKGVRHHRMFAELNLSAEQKDRLKILYEEMQAVQQKHWDEVKTVRGKIKTELLKPESSQNTLYGYAGELGELHKQISRERGDHLLEVKKVLSPEQFAKLVEKKDGMRYNKGFRDGKRGRCPYTSDKPEE